MKSPILDKKGAVHHPRHGSAQAVTPSATLPLCQKAAVHRIAPGGATALHTMVYTVTSSDHPDSCCARPSPGGHRPRGGGATRHIVAVPLGQLAALDLPADHRHRGGGAPDKGWRCPRGSTPSRVLPPFLHLSHHLCKCANTPSVSQSRASVLVFSQSFFKG